MHAVKYSYNVNNRKFSCTQNKFFHINGAIYGAITSSDEELMTASSDTQQVSM
jgi:hypothetical protein